MFNETYKIKYFEKDTQNQCLTKFDEARSKYLALSSSEQALFKTSNDYCISSARERYEAWAINLGKNPYALSDANSANIFSLKNIDSTILSISVLAVSGLSFISGYMLIKRRKSTINK